MCSVCEMRVTDKMVEAAKNFDKNERLEHLRTHDGAAAGVLPMFEDIDWDNIVFCVLHLYLRCTGKLIERLVLPLIDTEEIAKRVVDLLSKHSVRFNHVSASKEEANKNAHYDNFANHSWIGRDCDKLFLHIDEIFDIVFEGKADQSKKEVYIKVFDSFLEAYQALTHIDDSQEREPQVVQMQAKIDAFAALFQENLSGDSAGVYVHILVAHAAKQTRLHGCLTKFSAEALEHFHSRLKRISNRCGTAATATRDALRVHVIAQSIKMEHANEALKKRQEVQKAEAENVEMGGL